MKKTFRNLVRVAPTLLVGSALAQEASALQTAATTAISGAKTSAEAILVVALGVVGAFVLYKIIKRAFGKA